MVDGAAGTFTGCRLVDNEEVGLVVQDAGTRPALRNCRIAGNGEAAVEVRAQANAEIADCDLRGNADGPWKIAADAGTVARSGNQE